VQVAAMKSATADGTAAGISKHVMPRALMFFRWSAVVIGWQGSVLGSHFMTLSHASWFCRIGIGAWLGTIIAVQCCGY